MKEDVMDCAQAREEFSALLDGELTPEVRASIEAHLSECSDCLRELDGFKRVDVRYRALSALKAPDELEQRVRAATRRTRRITFARTTQTRPVWPLIAAAACVAIVAGFLLWRAQEPSPQFNLAARESAVKNSLALKKASPSSGQGELSDGQRQRSAADKVAAKVAPLPQPPSLRAAAPEESSQGAELNLGREKTAGAGEALSRQEAASPSAEREPARRLAADTEVSGQKLKSEQKEGSGQNAVNGAIESNRLQADAERLPTTSTEGSSAKQTPAKGTSTESGKVKLGVENGSPPPPSAPTTSPAPAQNEEKIAQLAQRTVSAPEVSSPPPSATQASPSGGVEAPSEVEQPSAMGAMGGGVPNQFGGSKEPPSAPALAAEHPQKAPVKTVGDHSYTLREGVWVENGFTSEKDVTVTTIHRGTKALEDLRQKYPKLSDILALGNRVITRLGDKWYRIEPGDSTQK